MPFCLLPPRVRWFLINFKLPDEMRPLIYAVLLLVLASGCKPPVSFTDQQVAAVWADMALHVTKATPSNSPTYASRSFGYIGLTMYESVVAGYPEYQSLAGSLNGLDSLPQPVAGLSYHWPLCLSAGQAAMIRYMYPQAQDTTVQKIDSLERVVNGYFSEKLQDTALVNRSIAYGRAVADAIFAWAQTDGGHRGYLRNFDKTWEHPVHPGGWRPALYSQSFSHEPLHPHWGKNRTFLAENAAIPEPAIIPYDTTPGSAYYEQFRQVYEKGNELTEEEKRIAVWWGDDPGETFTPGGHSYYLATLALKKTQPELIRWAETLARVGMSISDAFVVCWKWKYHFFTERANTFIPKYIDVEWESFWPDPPFPAFPSGHAIQSAAAATVLEDLYGKTFTFTDSAHAHRPPDGLRGTEFIPRKFESFWQAAEETANSRFYGGIHIPQDNAAGQALGIQVGQHVNALPWKKTSPTVSTAP